MTNRFLFASIVLFSFAEAPPPAGGFPVAAPLLDMQSTDTSGVFILVKKGKGHGDGEERFERYHRHEATAFPAIADIRMACAASTAFKGLAITQALEAATKTSPMAKTDPWWPNDIRRLVLAHLYGPAVCCKSDMAIGDNWSCSSVFGPLKGALLPAITGYPRTPDLIRV